MASSNTDGSSSEDWSLRTKELIDITNKDLRGRGHKASLEVFRKNIYIRGTFPERGRIKLNSGVKATVKGVALAETRLLDLLTAVKNTGSIPTPLPWENKILTNFGYNLTNGQKKILEEKVN